MIMVALTSASPSAEEQNSADIHYAFGFENERQLYTTCEENGRTVNIGSFCCKETHDIQSKKVFMDDAPQCEALDADDFLKNIDHYCRAQEDGKVKCVYDVNNENSACAQQTSAFCHREGGKTFASNVVLECDGLFTLEIKNSLTCMGKSCTHRDNQEYRWVGYFTTHDHFSSCELTELNGESVTTRRRNDAINAALSFLFGSFLLVGCVYIRCIAPFHRRQAFRHEAVPVMELSGNRVPFRGPPVAIPVVKAEVC